MKTVKFEVPPVSPQNSDGDLGYMVQLDLTRVYGKSDSNNTKNTEFLFLQYQRDAWTGIWGWVKTNGFINAF